MLYATASQTVGPYLHIGLTGLNCADLTADAPALAGQRVVIEGRVIDGTGAPVPDGMVEIWQANPAGRYRHAEDTREELPLVPGFTGFGRVPTAEDRSFRFVTSEAGHWCRARTAKPQAPHIMVSVFMRGLVKHVATRVYFPDETAANAADGVLALVPAERRGTLIATAQGNGALRWDVDAAGAG
ncbi:protocatechuate 3,4-dioxygenase subunit alpha [Cupriavidus basilensis]